MTYPHAFSGDRRVPLTDDKLHPFGQTPAAKPVRKSVQKQDRRAVVKLVREQVAEQLGIDYADTIGVSHEPCKVKARALCARRLTDETDMTRIAIALALGMKSTASVKRLLERHT